MCNGFKLRISLAKADEHQGTQLAGLSNHTCMQELLK